MDTQTVSADFWAVDGNAVRVERAANGRLVLVSYHEASGASIRTELESNVAAMVRDFLDLTFGQRSVRPGHA